MTPALVGRDVELATLCALVDGLAGGRGSSVLIGGEPGIGKTALAAATRKYAADSGAVTSVGSCWEAGGAPPFWPWVQVTRGFLRTEANAGAAAQAGPGLAPLLGEHVGIVPDSGPEAEFRVFDAIISFLDELARRSPVVVVLDDLQWADPASVRAAEFVARHLALAPVLLVSTCRGEVTGTEGPVRSLAAVSTNMPLAGLDASATGALAERSGMANPDGRALWMQTGGNPFFIEEVAREHASTGSAIHSPGLHEVLRRRVDTLGSETVRVLRTAAVVGRDFSPALVASAMGQDASAVDGALRAAADAGIVRLAPGAPASFVHDLLRETLSSDLQPADATAIHAAIVTVLQAATDERTAPAATLAEHAVAAGALLDQDVVLGCLLDAASEARIQHSPAEEVAFLRQAVDVASTDRATLARDLGHALVRAGHLEEARTVFSSLAEVSRGHDPRLFAEAALGLHQIGTAIEGADSVVGILAEAADGLRRSNAEEGVLARVLGAHSRALTHTVGGDRALAEDLSLQAVELARRCADDRTLGFCLLARHDAIWDATTAWQRLHLAQEMSKVATRTDDIELGLQAGHLRVTALLELGRPDARGQHRATAALARAVRLPRATYLSRTRAATLATLDGDFDRAETLILEAAELAQELDEPDRVGVSLDQRWLIGYLRGRPEDLDGDLAQAHLDGDPHVVVLEALLAMQRGDREASAALVEQVTTLGQVWPRWARSVWLAFDALLAVTAGDRDAIEQSRQAIGPVADIWAVLGGAILVFGPMRYWLAVLAASADDWDAVIASAEVAAESARRLAAPVWELLADIERLEALTHRGASGDLETARDLVEVLRDRPMLTEVAGVADRLRTVERWLDRTGAERRGEETRGVFRREGEVWRLGFDDDTVLVPDAKGLTDLHTLLSNPDREIPAIDLLHGHAGEVAAAVSRLGADSVLDETARSLYRSRLDELEAELESAVARHADERAIRLEDERDALLAELGRATGLGGRRRRLGDDAERARKTVSARIRDALRRLDDRHPSLAVHLRESVATGTQCGYRSTRSIDWDL